MHRHKTWRVCRRPALLFAGFALLSVTLSSLDIVVSCLLLHCVMLDLLCKAQSVFDSAFVLCQNDNGA